MRIDLHTHSVASDGTDTPADLVRKAAAAGLDVMAITDHDTSSGWQAATEAAVEVGITLVRGMEISTRLGRRSVHLLAYLVDPDSPALVAELAKVIDGRNDRVPGIVAALNAHGVEVTKEDVLREAGGSAAAGRPHVADAMVRKGIVSDRTAAFRTWLNPGRPGYVDRYAASLDQMIEVVAAAGGVTVLAHPWGRSGRSVLDTETIERLRGLGLAGIEVDHQDHTADDRRALRGIAADLDLVVTGSSDHHGLGKVDHELGVHTTAPEELERLLDRARRAAQAVGANVPEVVTPTR
jgi:predicted metal-dependent phosphoesterase TrpH